MQNSEILYVKDENFKEKIEISMRDIRQKPSEKMKNTC